MLNNAPEKTIVHFTNHYVPTRLLKKGRMVVTIHDLSPWRVPDTLPFAYLKYIRRSLTTAVDRADAIITPTEAIKAEVIELFGVPPDKVFACSSGIRPVFETNCDDCIEKDYATFLFVGTLEKRKNIPTLLRAFSLVRHSLPEAKLVLVGRPGYGFKEIMGLTRELNLSGALEVLGSVSDEILLQQYRRATALILPSLYEGFGTPIVEALAVGTPVIASDILVFREVVGDAAVYFGSPTDFESLASAMFQIVQMPEIRTSLVAKGKARAKLYNWTVVAERHVDVYKSVLNR